jgi:hypothetical protein
MKAKLFAKFAMIAMGAAVFAQGADAAQLFYGSDTQGHPCQIVFTALKFSSVVMHDACEFEMDGPGPWCEGKKPVPTRQAMGYGSLATVAGVTPFLINDPSVIVSTSTPSMIATGQNSSNLTITLTGPKSVSVHTAFLTAYGKSLTPAQRNQLLLSRPAGVSYEEVYQRIYNTVTCNAKN